MNILVLIAKFLSNSSYRRSFNVLYLCLPISNRFKYNIYENYGSNGPWKVAKPAGGGKKKVLCFTKTTVMMQNNSLIYYIFESTKLNADSNC